MEEPNSSLLLALVAVALVAVQLNASTKRPLLRLLNTGSISLSIGLVVGSLVALFCDALNKSVPLPFNFDLYMVCLPVFIYHQGLSTKSHHLFKNIVALVTLGVLGTIMSSILISLASYHFLGWVDIGLRPAELFKQSVALGVILSSTDSVAALTAIENSCNSSDSENEGDGGAGGRASSRRQTNRHSQLFYLVFGEGIFNDATAIVLLRSVNRLSGAQGDVVSVGITLADLALGFAWMMLASLVVGLGVGLLSAYLLKRWFHKSTDREVALLFTMGLSSFFLAEQLGLSGVFSIFFCGVTQSHYAWYNMSASAQIVSIYSSRVMSVVAEIVLFLGTSLSLFGEWDTIDYTKGSMMRKVMLVTPFLFTLVIVARFVVIMPMLVALKIRNRVSIFLAGSVRGAVTLALSVFYFLGTSHRLKHHEIILCASVILIVIASTIGLGTVIAYIFERKRFTGEDEEDTKGHEGLEYEPLPPPTHEGATVVPEEASLKRVWVDFDRRVLQPVFGGKTAQAMDEPVLERVEPLDRDAAWRPSPYEQSHQQRQSLLAPLFSLCDSRSLQRAELQIDAALLRGERRS